MRTPFLNNFKQSRCAESAIADTVKYSAWIYDPLASRRNGSVVGACRLGQYKGATWRV